MDLRKEGNICPFPCAVYRVKRQDCHQPPGAFCRQEKLIIPLESGTSGRKDGLSIGAKTGCVFQVHETRDGSVAQGAFHGDKT